LNRPISGKGAGWVPLLVADVAAERLSNTDYGRQLPRTADVVEPGCR